MRERLSRRVRTAAARSSALLCAVLAASTTGRLPLRWPGEGPPILKLEIEVSGRVARSAPERGTVQSAQASNGPEWNVALAHLTKGQRVGRLSVNAPWSDRRGQPIALGEYALRYAVQPLSKDHLGTAARRDFLVLVPRGADPREEIVAETLLWDLGRRASGTRHPAVMEIRTDVQATALAPGEEVIRGTIAGVGVVFLVAGTQASAGASAEAFR